MKRIEMFSTVCLDTSCYSTWNYFSQGSCHITHKVPVEQQHGSTELVQCTHKEDHFYPPSLARTTLAQGLPEENGFLVGWVGFCFFFFFDCFSGTVPVYPEGQGTAFSNFSRRSCRVRVCWEAAQAQHCPFWVSPCVFLTFFPHLFQGINHRIEILVLTIPGCVWVIIRQVS